MRWGRLFDWLWKKTPEDSTYHSAELAAQAQMTAGLSGIALPPGTPGKRITPATLKKSAFVKPVEEEQSGTSGGLVEGMVIGALLEEALSPNRSTSVEEKPEPEFHGFGGGESGGGGAQGEWTEPVAVDQPSEPDSPDDSPADSSSPDTSSSDS